jgi:protein-disulfide isomerase
MQPLGGYLMASNKSRNRGSRKRNTAKQKMTNFYIMLAGVLFIGILLIASTVLNANKTLNVTGEVDIANMPSLGDPNAPVTVVEYSDFQCPACAGFANQAFEAFKAAYIDTGKVRFVYHDFPLSQHVQAIPAAEAAACANDQGKYWEMNKMLFATQNQWSTSRDPQAVYTSLAEQIQLDTNAFSSCMAQGTHRTEVMNAQQAAINLNIRQTPTFVIDGVQYTSDKLADAIEQALAAKQ